MICEVESGKKFNNPKKVFKENTFNKMESGKRFNNQKQVFEKNSFKKLYSIYF